MQNLEPILIFITVAEMGSFTLAADSLGIQKGRASTAVGKLEEDVGVRLLHRTTRSVQLTEDRPCRPSWRLIPSWSLRCRVRIAKLTWFRRGLTAYCDLDPSGTRR